MDRVACYLPCLELGRHFGSYNSTSQTADLVLSEVRHAPNRVLPAHTHERPYITIVLDGTFKESYGSKSVICSPQTVLYHPRGEIHSDEFGVDACRCLAIDLSDDWEQRMPSPGNPVNIHGGEVSWVALRLYAEFRHRDAFAALAIEGLMLELQAGLARYNASSTVSSKPRWLKLILEQLSAPDLQLPTVRELAQQAQLHPVHFARVFRRHMKCSPADFIRRRRLDKACQLLKSSKSSIADVALEAGFSDQSHLSKVFRKEFGTTPAEFRARIRGG